MLSFIYGEVKWVSMTFPQVRAEGVVVRSEVACALDKKTKSSLVGLTRLPTLF